jgi:protein SCO1/2
MYEAAGRGATFNMMIPASARRFLSVAVLVALACQDQAPFHATVISDPGPAPVLRLADSRGGTFDLGTEKGRVVFIYFGYTHCPDVCPTTLADFARARRSLREKQRSAMRFVFVSVDPGRDTPTVTEKYVWQFDSTFVGLAPTASQLDSIRVAWGFVVEVDSMPGMKHDQYGVTHPAGIYMVGRDGRIRMVFYPAMKPDDLLADLKRVL